MTVTIRPAAPGEYDEIGDLTVEAYRMDGFIAPGSGYDLTLIAAAKRAAAAELWVAADATGLLGTVTYCPAGSPYREVAVDGEGEFRMLAVSPKARGLGVGTALAQHCLQRSRDHGLDRVVLCSSQNMTTAHRLYRRLGFTRLPERDWSPGLGIELYVFTLEL